MQPITNPIHMPMTSSTALAATIGAVVAGGGALDALTKIDEKTGIPLSVAGTILVSALVCAKWVISNLSKLKLDIVQSNNEMRLEMVRLADEIKGDSKDIAALAKRIDGLPCERVDCPRPEVKAKAK